MASKNDEQAFLESLKKVGKPKAATTTSEILKGLDTMPRKLPAAKPAAPPTLAGVAGKTALKALDMTILKPLQTLDTGRRAVISTVREVADILDTDPDTVASFDDWMRQTKNVNYGFGTAFPMKGWAGRIIGFIGDVALDPITYATLGGAVPAKALIKGGALAGKTVRSQVGRFATGREGRQKLASLVRGRLDEMVAQGDNAVAGWGRKEIDTIAADIASKGKQALYDYPFLMDEIGIKGPGVYYFGSRVKVPGTGKLGILLEKGITKTRLGVSTSAPGAAILRAVTPKGVGRIEQFGANSIRDARIALSTGRTAAGKPLSAEDAKKFLDMLEVDDIKRIDISKFSDQAARDLENVVAEAQTTSVPINRLLDQVDDPSLVPGVSPDDISVALGVRAALDNFFDQAQALAVQVGARPLARRKGYFPRMETTAAMEHRLKIGDKAFDEMTYGVDKSRTQSIFKERELGPGAEWFGKTLRGDETAEELNDIARKSGQVNFDIFETEISAVMAKYVRAWAEQMATFNMVKNFTDRGYIDWMEKALVVDPDFAQRVLVDAPARALNEMIQALRNWVATTNNGNARIRIALDAMLGDRQTTMAALRAGDFSPENLAQLKQALVDALNASESANQNYAELFRELDDIFENVDGLSNYGMVSSVRELLQDQLAGLRQRLQIIDEMNPREVSEFLEDFDGYAKRLQRFQRDMENISDAQAMLPTVASTNVVDGVSVYDAVERMAHLKGPKPVKVSPNPKWTPEMKQSVAGYTDQAATDVLLRATAGEPDETELANVINYIQARIIGSENPTKVRQKLTKAELNYPLLRPQDSSGNTFLSDLNNSVTTRGGVSTQYGRWEEARRLATRGDIKGIYMLQDMLHELVSLEQYRQWSALLEPYGIDIGDDIVNEILRRNAQPFLNDAIARGDTARMNQILDTNNIYGRSVGNADSFDHPFGSYRMVVDATIDSDDMLKEFADAAEVARRTKAAKSGAVPPEREAIRIEQAELKEFSAEQVKRYKNYKSLLRRVMQTREKDIERARANVRRIQTEIELAAQPYEAMHKRVLDIYPEMSSTRIDGQDVEIFLETEPVFAILEEVITKRVATMPDGQAVVDAWRASNHSRLQALGEMVWDPITKKEFSVALIQSLQEHIDNAMHRRIAGLTAEAAQEKAQIIRLISDRDLIESNMAMTPKTFFASERGQAETQDIILRGKERAVAAGKRDPRIPYTKQEAAEIQQELLNSDAYPVAKMEQRAANISHALAELDHNTRNEITQRFTPEEWVEIITGERVSAGSSRKMEAIVRTAQNRFKSLHRDEWNALNGQIADETAVQRMVQDLIGENPANAAPQDIVIATRKQILDRWETSEANTVLTKLNEVRAAWLAADVQEKSKNIQYLMDRAAQSVDRLETASQKLVTELDEWTPASSKKLDEIYERATIEMRERAMLQENVPENKVQEFENIYTSMLGLTRDGQQKLDAIFATPIERKSPQQLQDELRILKKLREDKIETPLMKERGYRVLVRERERALDPDFRLSPELRKEDAARRARMKDETSKTRNKKANQAALDRALNPSKEGDFTPGGKLKTESYQDFAEEQRAEELLDNPWVALERQISRTRTKQAPISEAPRNTEIDQQQLINLQADLENLLGARRTSLVDAARKDVADAARRVQQATAAYEQAENLATISKGGVEQLENDIRTISGLLSQFDLRVAPTVKGRGDRVRIMREVARRQGQLYDTLSEAAVRMNDALELVRHIASKDQIDAIDAAILAQIDGELQFFQSVANMSQAQFDRQMLSTTKSLLASGGTLMPDGRVRLADGSIVNGLPVDAVVESNQRVIKQGFKELNTKYFPELQATEEFAEMWNNAQRAADPEWVRKLAYYIGPYTKAWKAFAVLSPGFHVRNGIANAVTFTVAGGNIDNLITITPIYASWAKAQKAGIPWEQWLRTQPPDLIPMLQTARDGALGSGGGIFSETFKEATGTSRIYDNWLTRKNYAIGQAADNYIRFALAFDTAMKGGDTGLAQSRVKRFFFDYEDLSNLDKVMRQIIPFWLWTSRNLTMQLQNMWLNPRPYLIYESLKRNFRDKEQADPPFVRELGGFKLPFGEGLYLMPDVGFNRLQNDIAMFYDPRAFLNKSNPLIKIPAEQIMGESAFTGKEFETPQDRLLAALRAAAPPAGQAERLFANEGLSQLNAWLGYLGSPVRKYN